MKPIGIVRQIDDLGRVVIPKEWRKKLNIHSGDAAATYCDDLLGKIELSFGVTEPGMSDFRRKVDDLGRVVIPKSYRGLLEIKAGDELEMIAYVDGTFELMKYKK